MKMSRRSSRRSGRTSICEKLPATNKLLQSVLNDQAVAASTAKDYFRRKFPVTAEMPASYGEWTCDTADRKPESRPLRSYPSGHATLGYSVGVVLAVPDPREIAGDSGRGRPTMHTAARFAETTITATWRPAARSARHSA